MNSYLVINPQLQVTTPGECIKISVGGPMPPTSIFVRALPMLSPGLAQSGKPANGYHLFCSTWNGDQSIATSEVELGPANTTIPIYNGGRAEFRAYYYDQTNDSYYYLNQASATTSSGLDNCLSGLISFVCESSPEISLQLIVSIARFAPEVPQGGAIPVNHLFAKGVETAVAATTNLPPAVTATPQFSSDGQTFAAGDWLDHSIRKFVRVQLSNGDTSNIAQHLALDDRLATFRFGFNGNLDPGSTSVTIELKEKGIGGGNPFA